MNWLRNLINRIKLEIRLEIRWKYNRNNPSRLGEIRDSIRISMVFHEAACRRQASQRKEMRFFYREAYLWYPGLGLLEFNS